jgi:hypothetical protein
MSTNNLGEVVGLGVDVPCEVMVSVATSGRAYAYCVPHTCEADQLSRDEAAARAEFLCDLGRQWMFIVHHTDDKPLPTMVDLSGLAQQIRRFAEGDHGDWDELVVWRYLFDGTCRPTTVVMHEDSPVATVEDDEDGTVYLRTVLPCSDTHPTDGTTTARTQPTVDAPDGYEYTPAPPEVQRVMRLRFGGDGLTATNPEQPGTWRHDVGNWWDGCKVVADNGDGSYTYTCPYTGNVDRFSEAGYWTRAGDFVSRDQGKSGPE